MAAARTLFGSARAGKHRLARAAERGAGAALMVKVAHSLYRRWELMAPAERERLTAVARQVKDRALDLRGKVDRPAAERELRDASGELATAIASSAESDPAMDTAELEQLRAELAEELQRLAGASGAHPGENGRRAA